jgi:Arc/MetJ-type ribon-helix-helix transcriptional regulator
MKCYSLVIEPRLVKEIDSLIKKHGLYSSRSDFIRDAIRQRLIEIKQLMGNKQAKEGKHSEEEALQEGFVEQAMDEVKFPGVR